MDENQAQLMSETDPTFGRLNRLQGILRREDNRGVVLLASSYLDDLLARLISNFLIEGKSARSLIEGFGAPLGTFSSRIKAAHALGLVSDVQYFDLECLRKIRNEMAHTWDEIFLDTPQIADRIRAMSPTRIPDAPDSAAATLSEKLRQCLSCTMIELEVMLAQLKKGKQGQRLHSIAMHLSLNPS